jgi:hypothetical protein
MSLSSLLCILAITISVILCGMNEMASRDIQEAIGVGFGSDSASTDRCVLIMPQFEQEQLMNYGCPGKYLSYSENTEKLSCKKIEIARIWEDTVNILV